jgi:hypothetical protein
MPITVCPSITPGTDGGWSLVYRSSASAISRVVVDLQVRPTTSSCSRLTCSSERSNQPVRAVSLTVPCALRRTRKPWAESEVSRITGTGRPPRDAEPPAKGRSS